jgi:zinc protease
MASSSLAQRAASRAGSRQKRRRQQGRPAAVQGHGKTPANGLKIIIVPTGFPNIVSLQIPVQTGSRNEVEPGKSGFAHFFEHMMFRGTKAYPPEKYQEIITKAGARQNAYTSDDLTITTRRLPRMTWKPC